MEPGNRITIYASQIRVHYRRRLSHPRLSEVTLYRHSASPFLQFLELQTLLRLYLSRHTDRHSGKRNAPKLPYHGQHSTRAQQSTGKRPWQWSVNTSIGIQYRLTPHAGIYLEPTINYYIPDGKANCVPFERSIRSPSPYR